MECSKSNLATGTAIIGSSAPEAGTGSARMVLSECHYVYEPSCKVGNNGTITSEPLTLTLAFKSREAAEKEAAPNLVVAQPTNPKPFGSFASYTVSGGGCAISSEHFIQGGFALETSQGEAELLAHSFSALSVNSYFVNSAGLSKEKALSFKDSSGGSNAHLTGTVKLELASKSPWSIVG